MRISTIRPILLATAFALAGCGGGGGYGVGSTPPPPVTPTPTPTPTPTAAFALIPTATASQQFTVAGSTALTKDDPTPHLGAADQLQVRYVASSNTYEVQLPNIQSWIGLTGKNEAEATGGGVTVTSQFGGYQYSSLFFWGSNNSLGGVEAAGIATAAGAVPITGNATFAGYALGTTSERSSKLVSSEVFGAMTLNFDFAHGSLSGSVTPVLDPEWHDYQLGTLNFRNTVYSSGSTAFSGQFDTNLAGANSFSGLFTGANAQEVIGNFAFPYASPIDGLIYQAGGAFIAKK